MVYHQRMEAFGLHTLTIDGHDVEELSKAFYTAENKKGQPTALVCKTYKGRGFPNIEDLENWHGKALGNESQKVIQVNSRHEILHNIIYTYNYSVKLCYKYLFLIVS